MTKRGEETHSRAFQVYRKMAAIYSEAQLPLLLLLLHLLLLPVSLRAFGHLLFVGLHHNETIVICGRLQIKTPSRHEKDSSLILIQLPPTKEGPWYNHGMSLLRIILSLFLYPGAVIEINPPFNQQHNIISRSERASLARNALHQRNQI